LKILPQKLEEKNENLLINFYQIQILDEKIVALQIGLPNYCMWGHFWVPWNTLGFSSKKLSCFCLRKYHPIISFDIQDENLDTRQESLD